MASDITQQIKKALGEIPYAKTLGISAQFDGDSLTLILPFSQDNVGNPMLPALHGGAIAGFMEMAAICQLIITRGHTELSQATLPKPVGVNIDYLRRGRPETTYARARIIKNGQRISNVQVQAWQDDYDRPIATLQGNFLTLTAQD